MNDLISRKDALSLLTVFTEKNALGSTPAEIIKHMPCVEPVVRCKNCMYIAENFDPDRIYCKLWKHFVTAEWFCADGEMIEK